MTGSSAEAAALIDAVFTDFDASVAGEEPPDALLTTGQAAVLFGVMILRLPTRFAPWPSGLNAWRSWSAPPASITSRAR